MGTGTRIKGTGMRIGSGRAEESRKSARNRKTVSCRRHAGNGGDLPLGGKREKCRKERVGSVAANPDNLEAGGGEHKVLRARVRIVQVERV